MRENGGAVNFSSLKTTDTKAAAELKIIGKLDKSIYSCITSDLITDEVIITEERISHIKEHHPNDYELYFKYAAKVIEEPDYILKANKPNTAFVLKHITENQKHFQLILRLKTSNDPNDYKNSVITFLKIKDKEWKRLIKNKKILYKSE